MAFERFKITPSDQPGGDIWFIFMDEDQSAGYKITKSHLKELYKTLRRQYPEFRDEDEVIDYELRLEQEKSN